MTNCFMVIIYRRARTIIRSNTQCNITCDGLLTVITCLFEVDYFPHKIFFVFFRATPLCSGLTLRGLYSHITIW